MVILASEVGFRYYKNIKYKEQLRQAVILVDTNEGGIIEDVDKDEYVNNIQTLT